jgi:hypothetical protein
MESNDGPDPNCDTLHISGLNRDASDMQHYGRGGGGGVINPNSIMGAIANSSAIVSVRLPPGKAFGFVQFSSHAEATKALKATSGGISISGVFLSLKWAASSYGGSSDSKRPRKEQILEKVRRGLDEN